jgi:hypothetical protein
MLAFFVPIGQTPNGSGPTHRFVGEHSVLTLWIGAFMRTPSAVYMHLALGLSHDAIRLVRRFRRAPLIRVP